MSLIGFLFSVCLAPLGRIGHASFAMMFAMVQYFRVALGLRRIYNAKALELYFIFSTDFIFQSNQAQVVYVFA